MPTKKKSTEKTTVKRSRAGLGLFAQKPFRRGDFIIEYTGERIGEEEADRRGGKYLFSVDKNVTIDGTARKNKARYINHSCRPNSEAVIDGERVKIYAKKKIAAGEEITYHYGKEYFEDIIRPMGCRCALCLTET